MEQVAGQCLQLIDDLHKGVPPPRRHAGIADAMKEASVLTEAVFCTYFEGEPNPSTQKIMFESKVADSFWIINCSLDSRFAYPRTRSLSLSSAAFGCGVRSNCGSIQLRATNNDRHPFRHSPWRWPATNSPKVFVRVLKPFPLIFLVHVITYVITPFSQYCTIFTFQ